MQQIKNLYTEELIHPVLQYLVFTFLSWILTYFATYIFNFGIDSTTQFFISLILGSLLWKTVTLTMKTDLINGNIIKGYHLEIFGFVKETERFSVQPNAILSIEQDQNLYYNIVIQNASNKMIIRKMPNKIPANNELERIKQLIF